MKMTWNFEGYWNTVMGPTRSAGDIVREFELGAGRRGLDEWLGEAEMEAWMAGGNSVRDELPEEWAEFHARALDMLCEVTEANAKAQ
jgi:hypothetical protein